MSQNGSTSKGVLIWHYTALTLAVAVFLFMLALGVINMGDGGKDLVVGIVVAASSLVGLIGAFFVYGGKRQGVLFAAVPVAASLASAVILSGNRYYTEAFLTIAFLFAVPLALLASLIPIMKKVSVHKAEKAAGKPRSQKAAASPQEQANAVPKQYAVALAAAAIAQFALFFLPWLTLPNDVHLYTIPDILDLRNVLWRFPSDAFTAPKIFLWASVVGTAFAVVLQLAEAVPALEGKSARGGVMRAASLCALAGCACAVLMFAAFWICLFAGIYPTPWLIVMPAALGCQLAFAKKAREMARS